ncbi:aminotransferase class V-fold PLP-dependent enzyme [Alteromonas pelagimontana]|uniref:Aminotransferase class V-fold PLP-dependent enzyme n=1 Tax=Alteromonas pelagimontana TaxID=1858656 RepID=A0A6M4MCE3_9ALTE|nr:aminotransferase class V-fold PLP-dependent enzyme [Alteromonas pelagimontana]QJR80488.1 aminotransferase class V-fold PLP-dependent enzyme [Alteromonas pelagimontana]
MYQHFYSRFLKANAGKQHYSCHSHYYWPDVTRDAMCEYWDDSARWVDDKWQFFFETVVPEVQQTISDILQSRKPEQIVFAPNTHELLFRILSALDWRQPQKILSTDSEFHSFHRQVQRLTEWETIELTSVPTLPFASFIDRFIEQIKQQQPDVVFVSQVFFNSGFAIGDLEAIVNAVTNPDTIIIIDGYHGFMAVPTNLSRIADRIFYLAGGYKYAQAGEGACFCHVPPNCQLRPLYTGWFAEFGELDKARDDVVSYAANGMRFAGATMDFSALYRMRAVFQLFKANHITVDTIQRHVQSVQAAFLKKLNDINHPFINSSTLMVKDAAERGHFLTFSLPDEASAAQLAAALAHEGIQTDYRGDRLRFGFSLYHQPNEIDLRCLAKF